ncbi:hypothetical protein JI435_413670 [Parastagonospora nodorum SN15]|uniref:Uncharacterized protein n=1 Tax=Phaeosphaeria nodorum (strain SN15 / ATCC MYA-4574 / FGSC 10173) TaxID=321614 RepID=A0A7U2I4L7_PHANO|nr:hypothetical protein JI435_413670 [Parastagonospora nodorum SN15]
MLVARGGVGDGGRRRGAGRLLHPGVVGRGSVVWQVAIPPWSSYGRPCRHIPASSP